MTARTTGLERLQNHTFRDVLDAEIGNIDVLEAVIREASRRPDVEPKQVDRLLRAFVRHSLRNMRETYNELFALFWDDPDAARCEYVAYAGEYINEQTELSRKWLWCYEKKTIHTKPTTLDPRQARRPTMPHLAAILKTTWFPMLREA